MILYAILGLLFIVTVVLTVLSAKNDWHWLNPVLLIFIFIAGSAGMIGMAQTLNGRKTVLKKIEDLGKKIETAEAARQKVIYGDLNSDSYGPESLRGSGQRLELMKLGRGRTWANGSVKNVNGAIEFTFPSEQPVVENDDMSLENVELFAFADQPIKPLDKDGQPFTDDNGQEIVQMTPVMFVGKVLVTGQTPTKLTLIGTNPVPNFQEYGDPKAASWTLFERMPFDKRGIFKELYPGETGDGFDIANYRQFLMQNFLPPNRVGMDPTSAEYERLIDEFTFDGLSTGMIEAWVDNAQNRVSPRFEPDPSEVFVRYRFTENSKETYTVDDKSGKLDTDGTFSVQGQAVDPLLQLSPGPESRDVTFKKDDIVEIDLVTAQGYQRADGTVVPPFNTREPGVEEAGRIYRRKLVDFPYEMAKLYNRGSQVETDQMRLESNNEVQDNAIALLKAQQQERTRLKVAYENDNKLLQNDVDRILEVLQQREMQVSENTRRIDMLQNQLEKLRNSIEVRTSP